YHQGAGGEHQIALTFDDGPDPEWTPKILDILKAANAKAAFFVVGVNAEKYPALLRRIVNEGHEIGNHTYYHPNLALAWPEHVRLELNATQLLIETITGRATTLFRPPYAADPRRYDRVAEHVVGNIARRGDAAIANDEPVVGPNGQRRRVPRLSCTRRISLGLHDRRHRASGGAHASRDLSRLSFSTFTKTQLL